MLTYANYKSDDKIKHGSFPLDSIQFLFCLQDEILVFLGSGKYKNGWCPFEENIHFKICLSYCTHKIEGGVANTKMDFFLPGKNPS